MYSVGLLILLPFSLLSSLYVKNKLRTFLVGMTYGVFAVWLSRFANIDYWHPMYSFSSYYEDFLYGYMIGCCTTIIPDETERVRSIKERLVLIVGYTVMTFSCIGVMIIFNVKSIYFHILPTVLVFCTSLKFSGKKLRWFILNAIITCTISITVLVLWRVNTPDLFLKHWVEHGNPMFLTIPICEWIFSFCLGLGSYGFYSVINFDKEIANVKDNIQHSYNSSIYSTNKRINM